MESQIERWEKRLKDLAEKTPPVELPSGFYSPEGDCLFFYLEKGPHYAERIDNLLTIYRSEKNGKIVGVQVKGIRTMIRQAIQKMIEEQARRISMADLLLATHREQFRKAPMPPSGRHLEAWYTMVGSSVPSSELKAVLS